MAASTWNVPLNNANKVPRSGRSWALYWAVERCCWHILLHQKPLQAMRRGNNLLRNVAWLILNCHRGHFSNMCTMTMKSPWRITFSRSFHGKRSGQMQKLKINVRDAHQETKWNWSTGNNCSSREKQREKEGISFDATCYGNAKCSSLKEFIDDFEQKTYDFDKLCPIHLLAQTTKCEVSIWVTMKSLLHKKSFIHTCKCGAFALCPCVCYFMWNSTWFHSFQESIIRTNKRAHVGTFWNKFYAGWRYANFCEARYSSFFILWTEFVHVRAGGIFLGAPYAKDLPKSWRIFIKGHDLCVPNILRISVGRGTMIRLTDAIF